MMSKMPKKLSHQAAKLLTLIDEATDRGVPGAYWLPSISGDDYIQATKEFITIRGGGDASILRSLKSKGYTEEVKRGTGAYCFRVTEKGKALVEEWRTNNSWPWISTEGRVK